MTTAKDVMQMIKDNDVKYVDFRFTDPRGKWQHVTFDVSLIEEETFAEGQMFDGSSIAGWKAINESDMNLMPDPASATIDPFFAETTLSLVCDVLEPTTGEPYNRDPRGIAQRAEALKRKATDEQARDIDLALARLATERVGDAPGMGSLFKALAIAPPGTPLLPGFVREAPSA